MVDFCKYRHVFGIERQGVHRYRLFNIAIVDMVLTIIAAVALALPISHSENSALALPLHFIAVFFILLVIATLLHRLFCVDTTITRFVFD